LILERFELLGRVFWEGLEDCLVEGLAAGLLDGRDALAEDLDIDPLDARWPMRWASSSRGAKNNIKRAAKVNFRIEGAKEFISR